MLAEERKFRFVVTEAHRLPVDGGVAICARRPVAPLVSIVLRVAAVAVARQGRCDAVYVAGLTSGGRVPACKREPGAPVIECLDRPSLLVVAGYAVLAESAPVRVILSVAADACGRHSLPHFLFVTGRALLLRMSTLERKARRPVVKVHRLPVSIDMAR